MKNLITVFILLFNLSSFAQNADSALFYFNKANDEKVAKRYLVAAKLFDKAIKFNPNYLNAYLENGYTNLEMRKMDAAMQYFNKAHEINPSNITAINELANLYFDYRQYPKAIEMAQQCKGCPNSDKIIAFAYFKTEDYGKAEKMLLTYCSKNANDAEAYYYLAQTYIELNQEKNATTNFEKAVSLNNKNANWQQELGMLFYSIENYKSSAFYLNKAAENGFNQSNSFKEDLGFATIYSGDVEKGEKILQEVLVKKPSDKELLRNIADALYQNKIYDKALDYCQKLMELDAKDGKALYQAGLCFIKKGQKNKGQAMCDKAIEFDPSLNSLKQKSMMGGGM